VITLKVEAKQGEATSTYITVEQIVRADFYTAGRARNLAYAMVYMTVTSTVWRVGRHSPSKRSYRRHRFPSPLRKPSHRTPRAGALDFW